MRRLTLCLLLAFCFASQVNAQNGAEEVQSAPTEVHVKLVLPDNKKAFRIGDPVLLIMEFTADQPGYFVDSTQDHEASPSDKVSISPEGGVNYWRKEMLRGVTYLRDYFMQSDLSSTPTKVPLLLNESLRFDKPGHYTVQIATDRVGKRGGSKLHLTTNEVEFDVKEMTDAEEQSEIKRLTLLLDAKPNVQISQQLAQELSLLTGESATREKVRRFFQNGEGAAYMMAGFYIARNRDLVLQLLENGLRDVNQPMSRSLLSAVTGIRVLKENGPVRKVITGVPLTPGVDPEFAAIQNRYLTEIALSLSKRSGQSLTTTAMTILVSVPKSDPNRPELVGEAQRALMQNFSSLHPFDQEYLMREYWDDLRDPSMVTPLKQMLAYNSSSSKNVHDSALKRLIEISPEEARPLAINEICQPQSFIDREIISGLKYKELPEVDKCLSAQLRQYSTTSQGPARLILELKAALAVRFATANIYGEVASIFRERGPNLSLEARAALLAYLLKHNEDETLSLISQTLEELKPEQEVNFLPKLAELYYSEALGDLIKKRLESDEPQIASNAAYLIGKHGVAGDEQVLFKRLALWRSVWRDRLSEAEATHQGMIEREIVWALTNGKSWQLSADKVKELKVSCLTEMCKQSNRFN